MAKEPDGRETPDASDTNVEQEESERRDVTEDVLFSSISRRRFLKLLGAGAMGAAMFTGVGRLTPDRIPSQESSGSRLSPSGGSSTPSGNVSTSRGTGFTWDQTFTDYSWLTEADANGNLNVEVVSSTSYSELEDACTQSGPTVVVFEAGGVWDMDGASLDPSSETWIAGETAPSPGVSLIRGRFRPKSPKVIASHMGVFLGRDSGRGDDDTVVADNDDQLFDHITVAWSLDEAFAVAGDHARISLINSLIMEPLYDVRDMRSDDEYHSRAFHVNNDGVEDLCAMGTLIAHANRRMPFTRSPICVVSNYLYNYAGGDENGGNIINLSGGDHERATVQSIYLEAGEHSDTDRPVISYSCDALYYDDIQAPAGNPDTDGSQTIVDNPPIIPAGLTLPDDAVPAGELKDWMIANAGPRPADRSPAEQDFFNNRFGPNPSGLVDSQDEVGGYPDYSSSTWSLSPPSTGVVEWVKEFTQAVEGDGAAVGAGPGGGGSGGTSGGAGAGSRSVDPVYCGDYRRE